MTIFDGGVAVVTGAASGIGRATSTLFARDGCKKIVLGDLSEDGMKETSRIIATEYPDVAVATKVLDVSSETSVEEFYSFVVSEFGSIDYAANVAGVPHAATPLHQTPDSVFDKVYAVNQRGAFLCERAILKRMLKQERRHAGGCRGSIVVVTSQLAEMTCNGMAAYSATKAGARGMCRSDAMDYGPEGIRINTVGPGPTMTPLLLAAQDDKFINLMATSTPLQTQYKYQHFLTNPHPSQLKSLFRIFPFLWIFFFELDSLLFESSSDDLLEIICALAVEEERLNGESTDSDSPTRSSSFDSADHTKLSKLGDKSKKTKMERKTEKHVEDTETSSSCSASSFDGGSSKKRRRHRHSSDDKESTRENKRMTEKRVKERERRRRKLRRDGKKSRVYEYERSGIGSSPDGDVLERAEDDPESVLRDMFTEFPSVGNDLFQLLQMVDDGQAVNIRGISERSLIKHIRMLFLSLKLKEDGDRVFLLPEEALPTLEVVGPLIHSLMELKEQHLNHSVPESGIQVVAVDGGCHKEIFENIVSMPSCVEDDSNASKGRIPNTCCGCRGCISK